MLCHFAGEVRYEVAGFLSKNKDPLHEDLLLAVRESSLPLMRRLFVQVRYTYYGLYYLYYGYTYCAPPLCTARAALCHALTLPPYP